MRRSAFLAAAAVSLFGASVALAAASPAPSPSAAPQASGTPRPSAAASAAPTSSPSAKPTPSASPSTAPAEPSFNATVQPLEISGTATVVEAADKTGTVTLKLTGLVDEQRWTVDLEAGTITRPNERVEIAFKSGSDVTRLGTDTIRIRLTKAEMAAFLHARANGGAVAVVSDGTRLGYAEFLGS